MRLQQRQRWRLPPELRSAASARRLLEQRLTDLPDESLQVVLLLATELITNAVNHGAGEIGLTLTCADGHVRVDVEDHSAQRPAIRTTTRSSVNGRGMQLVDRLSSSWGVEPSPAGKTVWFTIDR